MKSWVWWNLTFLFGLFAVFRIFTALITLSGGNSGEGLADTGAAVVFGFITYLCYKTAKKKQAQEMEKKKQKEPENKKTDK